MTASPKSRTERGWELDRSKTVGYQRALNTLQRYDIMSWQGATEFDAPDDKDVLLNSFAYMPAPLFAIAQKLGCDIALLNLLCAVLKLEGSASMLMTRTALAKILGVQSDTVSRNLQKCKLVKLLGVEPVPTRSQELRAQTIKITIIPATSKSLARMAVNAANGRKLTWKRDEFNPKLRKK